MKYKFITRFLIRYISSDGLIKMIERNDYFYIHEYNTKEEALKVIEKEDLDFNNLIILESVKKVIDWED